MKGITLSFLFFFSLLKIYCQTEGSVSTCNTDAPTVAEVMIDACGDNEFYSEYVLLRVGNQPFNVRNYGLKVTNPVSNAFIGSVQVVGNILNETAIARLNAAVGSICPYGIVFRDVFSSPYDGVVPPNTALLVFNNKDSIDLTYLSTDALARLCGSKVFVAYGTLKAQSPGVSIFRNHPRNGSCGTTGCLRTIELQYEGNNAPFCQNLTYDIKNLPHLPGSNPPDGYGDGSYISPLPNGKVLYSGGNLTGQGVCIPPEKMVCKTPSMPDYGDGFWQVLVYEGWQNFINFKGFYKAKSGHTPSVSADTGSFTFNTALDGWQPQQAPSEAHPSNGALSVYDGCNVQADSFGIVAKRRNFPCGNYRLRLENRDDYTRIRIDVAGDGVFEFDKIYNNACQNACGEDIWEGNLNADSKMEIWGSDATSTFNIILVFNKKNNIASPCTPCKIDTIRSVSYTCNPAKTGQFVSVSKAINGCDTVFIKSIILDKNALKFDITISKSISCVGKKDGELQISNLTGQAPQYSIRWQTGDTLAQLKNIGQGLYRVTITDKNDCSSTDSIRITEPSETLLKLTNRYILKAGDSIFLETQPDRPLKYIKWTPALGLSCDTCLSTFAKPPLTTTYKIIYKDTLDCITTKEVTLQIEAKRGFYIPNSFSPNGDGVNDFFMIYGSSEVVYIHDFEVYNRWGNLVFDVKNAQPNDPSTAWNGILRGMALPPDMYIYKGIIEYKNGKKEVFQGEIALVR
jgi:gliding motility-associated-like protein